MCAPAARDKGLPDLPSDAELRVDLPPDPAEGAAEDPAEGAVGALQAVAAALCPSLCAPCRERLGPSSPTYSSQEYEPSDGLESYSGGAKGKPREP